MVLCCEAVLSQHSIRWASLTLAGLTVAARAIVSAQPQPALAPGSTSTFVIFIRGERVGSERSEERRVGKECRL